MNKTTEAIIFATIAHDGQLRKYSLEPYIHHPMRVASLVNKYSQDTDLYIAAILHDTIEDCDVTIEDIISKFNNRVAKIVLDLTNVSKNELDKYGNMLPRATRKQMDAERVAKISKEAKLIKLCDRYDNISDVARYDTKFAIKYANETLLLMKIAFSDFEHELKDAIKNTCYGILLGHMK